MRVGWHSGYKILVFAYAGTHFHLHNFIESSLVKWCMFYYVFDFVQSDVCLETCSSSTWHLPKLLLSKQPALPSNKRTAMYPRKAQTESRWNESGRIWEAWLRNLEEQNVHRFVCQRKLQSSEVQARHARHRAHSHFPTENISIHRWLRSNYIPCPSLSTNWIELITCIDR